MFGGTSPFGQQTGTSFFGNTSTCNFGQSSSPQSNSTPTFGNSTSSFGGSSMCGQKSSFGGFRSNTQTNGFGISSQQSQPAFSSNLLGSSSSFGASGQPSFGGTNTSFFGAATPTPGLGITTTSLFGASITPTFSSNSNPSLGFGSTSTFGQPTLTFGNTTFGTTSSSFGTRTSPFAQVTTSTVGSRGFGQPTVGGQPGGSRVAGYSYTSWQENGTNRKLQSISAMNVCKEKIHEELRWEDYQRGDKGGPTTAGMSFARSTEQSNLFPSSTPFLQTTSNPFLANFTTNPSTSQSNPFSSSSPTLFSQTTRNLFSTNAKTNPFAQTSPNPFSANTTTFPSPSHSNPFSSTTLTTFAQTTTNIFPANATTNPSTTQSNPFGSSSSTIFSQTTPNLFSTNAKTNPFNSTSISFTQTTPNLFSANTTTFPSPSHSNPFSSTTLTTFTQKTPNIFPANATTFPFSSSIAPHPYSGQRGSSWGQTSSLLNSFTASNLAQTPASSSAPFQQTLPVQTSTGISFSNLGTLPSNPFQPTLLAQTSNNFNFSNLGLNQSGVSGSGNGLNSLGQNVGHLSSIQKTAVAEPLVVRNPFGTLPAMPRMSIGNNARTSSSLQYGISSMPVVDRPTPVRISPLLTSRHLSQHRLRVPARKYDPKHDGSRVAFFSDENEVPRAPNADALLFPRENPRAFLVQPIEDWPPNSCTKEASMMMIHENGETSIGDDNTPNESIARVNDNYAPKTGSREGQCNLDRRSQKPGGFSDDFMNHKEDSHIPISGHRTGEPAIVNENATKIEAMMPKLRHSEYYTEPHIQELATKERDEPGFCTHVKDFVVGRHGYGSIKFLWHTDVRHLDLDSLVQFNNREVIVYMDESKKPPVGQGLNKPAEVTLLNIKFYDKKTGDHILDGPRIEKYKEMLKKKTGEQSAEFLSYHPVKGEWKFRVSHF